MYLDMKYIQLHYLNMFYKILDQLLYNHNICQVLNMYQLDNYYNNYHYKILMDLLLLNDMNYIYVVNLYTINNLMHISYMFLNKGFDNNQMDMMFHMNYLMDYNIMFINIMALNSHHLKIQEDNYIYLSYRILFDYTNFYIFF